MRFGDLFHWAPRERREAIRCDGLKPYQPAAVTIDPSAEWAHSYGCICLGPTPASAWSLSGGMEHLEEVDWDLWQVTLADRDEVRVRSEFGPQIQEVRVFNPIPADRIWWVGERS